MVIIMKDYPTLPEGYNKYASVDLNSDKKAAIIVNGLAVLIMVIMALAGQVAHDFFTLFDSDDYMMMLVKLIVLSVSILAYVILHELVHGVVMYYFSRVKPHFGYKGLYAYAGSTAYFCRKHYIIIALAPIVVWGIVLSVLMAVVPSDWFWIVYFIQITNISGAAGDMYVSVLFTKYPEDILVNDTGTAMTVYSKTGK